MADISITPLVALSSETKFLLSSLLNPTKIIPTCDNIPRDWRGLADLFLIGGEIMPAIANHSDPTGRILELVIDRSHQYTLKEFQERLEKINRWDVIDDAQSLFEKDSVKYVKRMEGCEEPAKVLTNNIDNEMLTIDDLYRIKAGLETQVYDAFLLCADEDFAQLAVENLEQKHNLKLCIKDRDLISGISFEHEAIMQLISERCNRLLVVMSPNFLKSPENKFFLNYAQAIGIEKRQRKIIPCLYKQCEIPSQLKYMYVLDYNKSHLYFYDFWKKLHDSIDTISMDILNDRNPKEATKLIVNDSPISVRPNSTEDQQNEPINTERVQLQQSNKSKIFSWSSKKRTKYNSNSDKSINNQDSDGSVMNLPSLNGLDSLESDDTTVSTTVTTTSKKDKKRKSIFKSFVGNKS